MLLRSLRGPSRSIVRRLGPAVPVPGSCRQNNACLIDTVHIPTRPALRPFFRTMTMMTQAGPEAAHKLLDFVNASPTPFHAVRAAAARLEKAGFQKVQQQPRVGARAVIAHARRRSGSRTNGRRA